MLHVDTPALAEIRSLFGLRADACISIYLSTTPQTQQVAASRIAFGNLAKAGIAQLDAKGFDRRRRDLFEVAFAALADDDAFWRLQAHSLAVLATPDTVRTYRLATAISDTVQVSDRLHLKPLLRAIAFPQTAFVLALSENAVRLIEVFADLPPSPVRIPGLPDSAADAVGRATVNDRSGGSRIHGSEGEKVLLRQFARQVDASLRPILSGSERPLVLAATEPLASIYRAVNTSPSLLPDGIATSPDRTTDGALATAARGVLDQDYAREVEAAKDLYQTRLGQGRATTDVGQAALAATRGAIELLLVDIDHILPGTVDEMDGRVSIASTADALNYDVIDEIAGRAILTGAKFLAVRQSDLPDRAPLAAILRYAP